MPRTWGLRPIGVDVRTPDDIETAFATMKREGAEAVVISGEPMFASQRKRFAELALRYRLPSIFVASVYPEVGGLMSYGANPNAVFRRAADFVAKILGGAKPADLPVELLTVYELVVNLKTAKKLGVTIPQSILLSAYRLIE